MTPTVPDELSPFLVGREINERSLLVLAAAESLTDALAHDLLRVALGEDAMKERFVGALHLCDFVVERNSEWHLAPRVREVLVERLMGERELFERVHGRLLELAEPDAAPAHPPEELPRYLQNGVGRAYHATFLSADGLRQYARLADQPLGGQQWLAGQLASEQVRLGVIPEDALEVMFLHGMMLYRERRRREAEGLLREVAKRSEPCHEVGVAAHLVGRMDARSPARRRSGESLLRKSLELLRTLNDPVGTAQVLHTLGQLVGRDRSRSAEAEELLRESLELSRTLGDPFGAAQVLHTLGQLVGRDRSRSAEAEELLRESLEVQRPLDHPFGDAQALHTLGKLVGRDRSRRAEAEELLRESLEIGRDLKHPNHQAQVLYSISQLTGTHPDDAEALLMDSLELNRQTRNSRGERIVQRALERLGKKVGDGDPT
jgi:tetratricopeptide (TPR) repeat protein